MRAVVALAVLALAVACKKEEPQKPVEPVKPTEPVKPVEPVKTATKAAEQPAEPAPALSGKTGIAGTIKFEGAVPAPRAIDMKTKPECVKANPKPMQQDVEVKDGKLKGVLVYVKSGLPAGAKYQPKTEAVELDQKGCVYEPHVVGVQVGQPFSIVNSDKFLHNVHVYAKGSDGFNQGMPKPMKLARKFKKGQMPVEVKCDVHSWMLAHLGIFDHPFFAVSNDAGAFEIPALPAGTYELAMYHPTLGEQTQQVTVKDGAASVASATFKATK